MRGATEKLLPLLPVTTTTAAKLKLTLQLFNLPA
jgi:hypothetical protein